MKKIQDHYEVIVIGAGHAGIEAALAAARLGCRTLLATLSLDNLALMPCNPSIGGPAKGHLVREIDALGGQMGLAADKACLQMRLLNTGKGHAVHALRGQEDKAFYHTLMKETVEEQERLELKQLMIDRLIVEQGRVVGVEAESGELFGADCVILASGTYLRGAVICGQVRYECGPNGLRSARKLSASLQEAGVLLQRFKTGTPARLDAKSLDYAKMQIQEGDEEPRNFSFLSPALPRQQLPCWLTYTNEKTHKIVRDNLHLSGLFNGMVEGVGPRYCPSIESKLVRFASKERHQLFIEPEGRHTREMYVQGMSSSLPAQVQLEFLQTIPGLEHCRMMRAGYAIDYDCLDPLQLRPSLEHKSIEGLFSAGQSNGSSGYEEAAAQGLMAGINAARKLKGLPPCILRRDQAYIGVLIDDLVTKGTDEPYRMMTSRAEYRLLLRQDNADLRLTELGQRLGLVDEERYSLFTAKRTAVERALAMLAAINLSPDEETNAKLIALGSAPVKSGINMTELLRRKELSYQALAAAFSLPSLAPEVAEQAEIDIKYEGYIAKQKKEVERFLQLEDRLLPEDLDYKAIKELSSEAAEKLEKIRPRSLGQAGRISGVSPADVNVLLLTLEVRRRRQKEREDGV